MENKKWRLGIIGFGNVGQGFVRILANKKETLKKRYNFDWEIVGIADPVKGSVYDPEGIDVHKIVELIEKEGNIKNYPSGKKDIDSFTLCRAQDIDIIIEVTPTNVKTGEPGITHIRESLIHDKHVVTSNKGPIALDYGGLTKLAEEHNVSLKFEATVLSGTPSINLGLEALAGADIDRIEGIVNGTTNFILSEMEKGKSYSEALKEAQRLGYAETDPTGDVEGWDATVKTVILANVLMGGNISIEDVEREGITKITKADVMSALKNRERIKLIAEILKEGERIKASVKPKRLPLDHPLANVMGATNALTFYTDHLGKVTIIGPGAGRIETGQGILSDVLSIHRMYSGR